MHRNVETDLRVLASAGCEYTGLSAKERWQFEQSWRQVFARPVKESTGHWTHRGFDWHAFSFGFTKCARNAEALEHFGRVVARDYLFTPLYPDEAGNRCRGGALPSYFGLGVDRYLFDPACTWTMVFTHEAELGPYYCESRWLATQGDPVA